MLKTNQSDSKQLKATQSDSRRLKETLIHNLVVKDFERILNLVAIIIAIVGNTAENTQPSHNANKTVPSLVGGKISFQTLPHLSPEDDVS